MVDLDCAVDLRGVSKASGACAAMPGSIAVNRRSKGLRPDRTPIRGRGHRRPGEKAGAAGGGVGGGAGGFGTWREAERRLASRLHRKLEEGEYVFLLPPAPPRHGSYCRSDTPCSRTRVRGDGTGEKRKVLAFADGAFFFPVVSRGGRRARGSTCRQCGGGAWSGLWQGSRIGQRLPRLRRVAVAHDTESLVPK